MIYESKKRLEGKFRSGKGDPRGTGAVEESAGNNVAARGVKKGVGKLRRLIGRISIQ